MRNMGDYGIPLTNDDDLEDNSRVTFKRAKLLENGKATQMFLEEEDRLSSLPDSLLLHILSFIYCLKEISRTCVLSKRWQFLWLDLPEFNFYGRGVVDWVDKTLSICSGIHLKKFRVMFIYQDCKASSVNSWLQFVTKNKVESVDLDLGWRYCEKDDEIYKLPQMMYSNSSLTYLRLVRCVIAPLEGITVVEWKCLKELIFSEVELSESVVGSILSGCPVLEYLWLFKCWGTRCLDIKSRSPKSLVIEKWKGESLEIFAPFIQNLEISECHLKEEEYCREFRIMGISPSLVRARLYYGKKHINLYRYDEASTHNHKWMDHMKQLLGSLQHVLDLGLAPRFIEVLSVLEVKWGWRLPQYSCKVLRVQAFRHSRRSIPTILGILESSPKLERLIIYGIPASSVTPDPVESSYLRKVDDLKCDLLHLKTVEIGGCTTGVVARNLLKLVQVLLKRAKVLEKMEISVAVSSSYGTHYSSNIQEAPRILRNKISQALLSYPRSSTKILVEPMEHIKNGPRLMEIQNALLLEIFFKLGIKMIQPNPYSGD